MEEAFGSGDDGVFGGAWGPAEEAAGFLVGGVFVFTEFGEDLFDGWVGEGGQSAP